MTSDPARPVPGGPADGVTVTAIRPRLTGPGSPARSRAEVGLSEGALAGLRRISGHRPVEELAVLTAAVALVLAAAEAAGLVALAVDGPPGRIGCELDLDGLDSVADLVLAVDGQFRAPASGGAPPLETGRGVTVAASWPSAPDGALSVQLLGTGPADRRLTAACDPAIAEGWFAEVFARSTDHVLSQFTEPGRPLAGISVLGPPAADQVAGWERQSFAEAPGETLLPAIYQQADARPGQLAVVAGEQRLDYQTLTATADRVAVRLRERGVGSGDRVALIAAKSAWVIPVILGVLRAGAAYVPLDPAIPAARRASILADAGCAALIGSAGPGEPAGPPVIDPASLTAASPGEPDNLLATPLPPPPEPDDLAYVIYTSGSTGEPKGVAVPHRAICSYLAWKHGFHRLTPQTRLLQVPSLAFDSSISDVFSVLRAGGRLVLLPDRDRLDRHRIRELGQSAGITDVTLVPSLYRVLSGVLADCPDLQLVTVAGEAMPPQLVTRHQQRMPTVRLINEYGPTENSVGATALEYSGPVPLGFCIGRPITSTVLQILGPRRQPVPPGFPGEIHLAGRGLAAGYLGRPEATGQSFTAAAGLPGGRRYATGDLAWWRPDGQVEFLGRTDSQVKVRGYRVELGEVEAALTALPDVLTAAVVPVTDRGVTSLAGYVVAPGADPAGLRAALGTRLPRQLVPDRIVVLADLPLTSNGKIDRRALADGTGVAPTPEADPSPEASPAPETSTAPENSPTPGAGTTPAGTTPAGDASPAASPAASAGAPAGSGRAADPDPAGPEAAGVTLTTVAELFAETLGLDSVGPDDDFFNLGGHSLRAVELLMAIESRLGRELTVDDVFSAPTPSALHALIVAGLPPPGDGPPPAGQPLHLPPAPAQDDYPLTPAQRLFWTQHGLEESSELRLNLVEGFWLDGDLPDEAIRRAVRTQVAAADVLCSRIVTVDGEPRMRPQPLDDLPLRIIGPDPLGPDPLGPDPLGPDGTGPVGAGPDDVARDLIEQEYATRFDLASEPPVRITVYRAGPARSLLLVTCHHIACDGRSATIFIGRLLRSLGSGGPEPAAGPAPRYRDYAMWLLARQDDADLDRSRAHWLDRLGGYPAFPLLPADGDRGRPPGYSESVAARLPEVASSAIRAAARGYGVSDFSLLLATAVELLHRFTGMTTIDVGTPVSIRDHPDCQEMIGPLVNTVVLRTQLDPDRPYQDLVTSAHDAVLDALAHPDHPFEDLSRLLPGAHAGGRTPVFTVHFSVDEPGAAGTGAFPDPGPGLSVTRADADLNVGPYELSLHVDNSGPQLRLVIEYDATLFTRARADRLLRHWADLAVRSPDGQRITSRTPLPPAEETGLAELARRRPTVWPVPGGPASGGPISGGPISGGTVSGGTVPRAVAAGHVIVAGPGHQPVPVGVPGEVLLAPAAAAASGTGVAGLAGLARPSGWSGSWREDGALQLRGPAGRVQADQAGPVDPADAELLLRAHPAVVDAQVEPAAAGRLHARVTPRPVPVSDTELRSYLRRHLPERLVPTVGIVRAEPGPAPEPDRTAPVPADGRIAAIADIFAAVLKTGRPEPDADFFELGGSSLDAMLVASKLRSQLGVGFDPRAVFTARTPRGLAGLLSGEDDAADTDAHAADTGPPPEPGHTSGRAPLSADQEQLHAALQAGVPEAAFAMVECFQLGPVDPRALRSAIATVLARHGALTDRLETGPDGAWWVPVPTPDFGWAVADLSDLTGDEQATTLHDLLQRHTEEPFDLAAGRSVRALLIRRSDQDHVLALALHHLTVDGHSVDLIVQQLAAACRPPTTPATSPAPPDGPALSAADVYAWQRRRLANGGLAPQLARWRELSGGPVTEPALPWDRPRLTRAALIVTETSFDWPPGCAARITELSATLGATPFMTFLAAFAVLIAPPEPPGEARIATTVSMRGRPELAGVAGLLSTTAVLRIGVAGDPGFATVVQRVRASLLDAHLAAEVPFAQVAEILEQEQDIDRADLARVLVVAYEPQSPPAGWARLETAPGGEPVRPTATAYDLSISVQLSPAGVNGTVAFRQELFDPDTIAGLLTGFGALTRELLRDPDSPISQVRSRAATLGQSRLSPATAPGSRPGETR